MADLEYEKGKSALLPHMKLSAQTTRSLPSILLSARFPVSVCLEGETNSNSKKWQLVLLSCSSWKNKLFSMENKIVVMLVRPLRLKVLVFEQVLVKVYLVMDKNLGAFQ